MKRIKPPQIIIFHSDSGPGRGNRPTHAPSLILPVTILLSVILVSLLPLLASAQNIPQSYFREEWTAPERNGLPVPTVARLFPIQGPKSGGTVITVWGTGFTKSIGLTCRFNELGNAVVAGGEISQTVSGLYVSDSKIECVTPLFMNQQCSASGPCPVKVTVSNDGEIFSSYVTDWNGGTALDFTWDNRVVGGTFAYDSASNSTGPLGGYTWIQVVQTFVPSLHQAVVGSSNIYCVFGGTLSPYPVTWLGIETKFNTSRSIFRCQSPPSMVKGVVPLQFTVDANSTSATMSVASLATFNFTYIDTSDTLKLNSTSSYSIRPTITNVTTNHHNPYFLARGPLIGNTEITVTGKHFHPSERAMCMFVQNVLPTLDPSQDSVYSGNCYNATSAKGDDELCPTDYGWSCCTIDANSTYRCCQKRQAQWVSMTQVRCMTPQHTGLMQLTNYVHPEAEQNPLQLTPGFQVTVLFSSDDADVKSGFDLTNITTYSNITEQNLFTYSDLYVSPAGDDFVGKGTFGKPLRTVEKAVEFALYNRLNGRKDEAVDTDSQVWHRQFNPERIILLPGTYRGPGNVGVHSRSKVIDITSVWETFDRNRQGVTARPIQSELDTVIDCGSAGMRFVDAQVVVDDFEQADMNNVTVTTRGLSFRGCLDDVSFGVADPFSINYANIQQPNYIVP